MADRTSIEWTDSTWSPVTGCSKVSPGCDHCYADTIAHRFAGTKAWPNGFDVTLWPDRLDIPLKWRKPRKVFVCSTADLFHDRVPDEYIAEVFSVMRAATQHTFQVLTKRHSRMRSLVSSPKFQAESARGFADPIWPLPNVWLGVSAENQQWADIRIPGLLETPAAVRFVSAEPLLGPIDLLGDVEKPGPAIVRTGVHTPGGPWGPDEYDYDDQIGIDWVIVGGESGHGARPMHPWWAESLQQQCEAAGVPFLFKQWGEWTPLAPLDAQGRFDFSNGVAMTDDGNMYRPGDLTYPDGPRRGEAIRADFPHHHPTSMYRLGKKRAGRELYHDGRTFDEYPETVHA